LLYLSSFFEKNKGLYYDNLTLVRTRNDMLQWIKYFLVGVEQTATQAAATLNRVLSLKSSLEEKINATFGRRSHSAQALLKHLFHKPVITIDAASKLCGLSFKATSDLIIKMQQEGILKEVTGQQRNRLFVFEPYIDAFEHAHEHF
jgi:Fic family protein